MAKQQSDSGGSTAGNQARNRRASDNPGGEAKREKRSIFTYVWQGALSVLSVLGVTNIFQHIGHAASNAAGQAGSDLLIKQFERKTNDKFAFGEALSKLAMRHPRLIDQEQILRAFTEFLKRAHNLDPAGQEELAEELVKSLNQSSDAFEPARVIRLFLRRLTMAEQSDFQVSIAETGPTIDDSINALLMFALLENDDDRYSLARDLGYIGPRADDFMEKGTKYLKPIIGAANRLANRWRRQRLNNPRGYSWDPRNAKTEGWRITRAFRYLFNR